MPRRDLISLLLILIVAALLRLGEPGVMEFFHDEAILSLKAQALAHGENFPLTGIVSSVGIPNPPTSVYVVALPYLFTDNPLYVTLFIAALNVAGVGLLWLIARRYFNRTIALVAGLAYAVSPWALLYSRKIWAQDFHTPFVLLALLLGLEGFVRGKKWAQVTCLPVLLFALQIHFAAWALLPLYFVLVWMGRERLSRPALMLSLILSALVLLTYAVGLTQTLTDDPSRLNTTLDRTSVRDGLSIGGDALRYTAYLATGLGLETWVAPNQQEHLLANVPVPAALWLFFGVIMLFGFNALWSRYRPYALFVTVWALLPTLIFLPTWTTVYPHYFIASIPAWMLLAGLTIDEVIGVGTWLVSRSTPSPLPSSKEGERVSLNQPSVDSPPPFTGEGREGVESTSSSTSTPPEMRQVNINGSPIDSPSPPAGRGSGGGVNLPRTLILFTILTILTTQAIWWRGMLRYVEQTEISLGAGTSGFTTPLRYLLPVQQALRGFEDVVVVSNGMWTDFDVEAARWPVMLRNSAHCVRTLPADEIAVFPAGRFAALIAPNAPETRSLYHRTNSVEAVSVFPTRDERGAYIVNRFEAAPQLDIPFTAIEPVTFANGVRLTGYAFMPERVYLEWSLPGRRDDTNDQYFIHLLDANGQNIGQRDASFWPGRHWCENDRLVTWQSLDTTGAVTLRTGFYTLGKAEQYIPVDVLDALGNPAGNWFDIALSGD